MRRWARAACLVFLAVTAIAIYCSLRLAAATDYAYSHAVKDPERTPPPGDGIVAPADGTVLYVRRFEDGQVPLVIKGRAQIPISELVRADPAPRSGVIIGVYMNTFGVHVNRAPISGRVELRRWYNGPQLDMSRLEKRLILSALVPGPELFKKLLGLATEQIVSDADYITRSARETLVFSSADLRCTVVRIADYWVGKVLTWVGVGQSVARGERIGMITWGSQTDLIIEAKDLSSLRITVREGDYVHGGETVLAEPAR